MIRVLLILTILVLIVGLCFYWIEVSLSKKKVDADSGVDSEPSHAGDDAWELVVKFGEYLDQRSPNILDEDLLPFPKKEISETLENCLGSVSRELSPEMISDLSSAFSDMNEYRIRLAMHVKIDPQDRKLVDEINKPFGISMRSPDEEIHPDDINSETLKAHAEEYMEAVKKNPENPFAGIKVSREFDSGVKGDPQKKAIKNKYSKLSNESGIAFCEKQGIDFPSSLEIPTEKS